MGSRPVFNTTETPPATPVGPWPGFYTMGFHLAAPPCLLLARLYVEWFSLCHLLIHSRKGDTVSASGIPGMPYLSPTITGPCDQDFGKVRKWRGSLGEGVRNEWMIVMDGKHMRKRIELCKGHSNGNWEEWYEKKSWVVQGAFQWKLGSTDTTHVTGGGKWELIVHRNTTNCYCLLCYLDDLVV